MKILLLILILAGLIGGYTYASQQNWLPSQVPKISFAGDPQNQLGILSSRAQEFGGYAQGFINNSIQVDTREQSLSQKAIDYGQYMYCKQVVTAYEQEKK